MRTFEKPQYQHNCEACVFLGRYTDSDQQRDFDLYVCPQGGIPTVIARFGNDGPEYSSGLPFALEQVLGQIDGNSYTRALAEALRRAVASEHLLIKAEMIEAKP